jgi:hypothetical protein
MEYMTDAEAERLDEYYTKNTIIPEGGKIGGLDRLKESLRPGEKLSFKCIIESDEDNLADVFDDTTNVETRELAAVANA